MMKNRIVSRKQIKDYNLKINIFNGVAFSISLHLVKPYYAKFAERLGANDYHFALLNALPALLSVFAFLPGALMIEKAKSKTKITSKFLLAQKLIYLSIIFVPFLTTVNQPLLFVVLIGLMNFPGSVAIMGYQSSIGDIFRPRERSRAMSLRNRFSDFSRLIISFIAGQVLTLVPKTPEDTLVLYQIFFGIAFIFGIFEMVALLKFKEHKTEEEPSDLPKISYLTIFITTIKSIPKKKKFVSFIICSILFHFGWQMGWPLFSIYTIKILGANESWLSIMTISSGISSIIASIFWAKLADKKGNSFTLAIATMGMAVTPIFYAISRSLFVLVFFVMSVGVFVAGTVLTLFNLLLEVTPNENRTVYIAVYNILINISATIAPLLGVWIKDMTSIYVALVVVAIMRMTGSIAFFIRNKRLERTSQ